MSRALREASADEQAVLTSALNQSLRARSVRDGFRKGMGVRGAMPMKYQFQKPYQVHVLRGRAFAPTLDAFEHTLGFAQVTILTAATRLAARLTPLCCSPPF